MVRWIPDSARRTRNWIAAGLYVCWLMGGAVAWWLYFTRSGSSAEIWRVTLGIAIAAAAGMWVSFTFLDAAFRRLFGWRWVAMDFAKYDYAAHLPPPLGRVKPRPHTRRRAIPAIPRDPTDTAEPP